MEIVNKVKFDSIILRVAVAFLIVSGQVKGQEAGKQYLPEPKNGHTYVIAHRGAHKGIPENSLAAYQKAIDLGCDLVEIDVRSSKDGHIVSVHNSSIEAYVSGASGRVNELTLAELKALDIGERFGPQWKNTRIPTFEEILELCRGRIGIYLDLKEPLVPELVDIIKEFGMEGQIVWYIPASFMGAIRDLKLLCPQCLPMPDPGSHANMPEVVRKIRPPVIATDMSVLSKAFVQTVHEYHAKVFVDEMQGDESEWTRILDWETDGIQTDHPRELIRFLSEVNPKINSQ